MSSGTSDSPDGPTGAASDARQGISWRTLLCGLLVGLAVAGVVGLPLTYWAYRAGRGRGAAAERERGFARQELIEVEPLLEGAEIGIDAEETAGNAAGADGRDGTQGAAPGPPHPPGPPQRWVFGPTECVRCVWPMEVVPKSTEIGRPHFRIRQGSNRLARKGSGLAEFAFRVERECLATVFLHVRYGDDCGNSLKCRINGGPVAVVAGASQFGKWLWDRTCRRFHLKPGLQRLTVETSEDGVEFDKLVVAELPLPKGFDALRPTPTPAFGSLPVAAEDLPRIGPVEAQAFATGSMVVGEGHRNTLAVRLRLNGREPVSGRVAVRCRASSVSLSKEFALTPKRRGLYLTWDLKLAPHRLFLFPVEVEVTAEGRTVHKQEMLFINPLQWAFLGPAPDPKGKGLDLPHPFEKVLAKAGTLPEIEGWKWKIAADGSCYDEFGLVDLNKVFGRPNPGWHYGDSGCEPVVAYAVTAVPGWGSPHDSYAYGGDDCVRVWQNGREILRVGANMPLEVGRQVVGTKIASGLNVFVFKVPQTGHYWHILFEPDRSFPYGRTENFYRTRLPWWHMLRRNAATGKN